jgi:glycerophosphoryl diester phosphodiesterase
MDSDKKVENQAHRGASNHYPENTLAAFQAAWECGADVIELDIQLTKDKTPIIYHDFFISSEHCHYKNGERLPHDILIKELFAKEIKDICFDTILEASCHIDIPTLEDVIAFIQASPSSKAQCIRLNIELKKDPRHPELSYSADVIVDEVLKIISRMNFETRVQYSSFDPEILQYLRNKVPESILSCLYDEQVLFYIHHAMQKPGLDYLLDFAKQIKINILSPDYALINNPLYVKKLQDLGFHVVAWTVNKKCDWEKLIEWGINGIVTDKPEELHMYLEGKNKKNSSLHEERSSQDVH